jgi:catechol 2,3-dioxygenase-like lactoylglutathione lyase family enzyme
VARIQLALNVSNLDEAVDFYSKLFGTEPAKRYPGYANFAVSDPPLKLVLFEGQGAGGTLNHLGVEVPSVEEVRQAGERLSRSGLTTAAEEGVTCCYALQDKVWATDPDGLAWEHYVVLADTAEAASEGLACDPASACCPT